VFLAIDLALNESGYCFYKDKGLISGVITRDKRGSQWSRIRANIMDIMKIVNTENIEHVCIEALAFSFRSSSASILAEQQGALKHELLKNGIQVSEIPITAVKKHRTGSGSAKKEDVALKVKELTGIDTKNNNKSDAISIWLYVNSQEAIPTL